MLDTDAHSRYGQFLIQLIVKRPSLTSPFLELGQAYIKREQWDKAAKSFEQALAMVEDLTTTGEESQGNCLKGATLVCIGAQKLCEKDLLKAHEYFARSERPFRNGKEFYGCAVALLANGILCELNMEWREVFFYYDRAEKMLLSVGDADSKELYQMVKQRHDNARKMWQRSFDNDPEPSPPAADQPNADSPYAESGVLLQFLPIFGSIPAGDPHPVPKYVTGYIETDRLLINGKPYVVVSKNHLPLCLRFSPEIAYVTFLVQGDSMNKAAINDGDYVILRIDRTLARLQPQDGDIVAVVLPQDDIVTLKRFHRGENKIYFEPESTNPSHPTRTFPSIGEFDVGLRVVGILVAVLAPAPPV